LGNAPDPGVFGRNARDLKAIAQRALCNGGWPSCQITDIDLLGRRMGMSNGLSLER